MEETLPQSQAPVDPVPVPPAEPPPPKRFPLKWLIIVILLAGIVLTGTYLIFKSQSKPPEQTPQIPVQSSSQSTPNPTSDLTIDWKIYTNTGLGFSVKYSSQTKIIEGGKYSADGVFAKNPNMTSFDVNVSDQESKESGFGNMQLSISVEENKNGRTLESLRQEFNGQNSDEDIEGDKIQSFLLDGKPAIRGAAGGSRGAYIILSIYKDLIYRLVFEPDINKTGDQILSTFKFLDNEEEFNNKFKENRASARDIMRRADLTMLLNTIYQYSQDNQGNIPSKISGNVQFIRTGGADICSDLIPKYFAVMPQDPSINDLTKRFKSCSENYDTGYTIVKDPSTGKITLGAPFAEQGIISVTK